mmetsp:Transcript_3908/g.11033  ORF Transcript_3908/g.11033 Transcript_3908/m.11033 type:complete len:241 (+) Transcript_3908:363-1085(+)
MRAPRPELEEHAFEQGALALVHHVEIVLAHEFGGVVLVRARRVHPRDVETGRPCRTIRRAHASRGPGKSGQAFVAQVEEALPSLLVPGVTVVARRAVALVRIRRVFALQFRLEVEECVRSGSCLRHLLHNTCAVRKPTSAVGMMQQRVARGGRLRHEGLHRGRAQPRPQAKVRRQVHPSTRSEARRCLRACPLHRSRSPRMHPSCVSRAKAVSVQPQPRHEALRAVAHGQAGPGEARRRL